MRLAQRRSRDRQRKRRALRSAPRHPPGPEGQIRHAVTNLLGSFHRRIIEKLLELAPHHARHARRRHDALDPPHRAAALMSLRDSARRQLATSPFAATVNQAAEITAVSVTTQTAKALNLGDDFAPEIDTSNFADEGVGRMAELMGDSLERAGDILDEWAGSLEDEPDDEDVNSLETKLEEGLGGVLGAGLAWASLSFGMAFADYVQTAQRAGGVNSAIWKIAGDSHVRPEHRVLDGIEFSWSDEPPLSAEDADIGEACFPGEDYG
jgi:hypothetical protein